MKAEDVLNTLKGSIPTASKISLDGKFVNIEGAFKYVIPVKCEDMVAIEWPDSTCKYPVEIKKVPEWLVFDKLLMFQNSAANGWWVPGRFGGLRNNPAFMADGQAYDRVAPLDYRMVGRAGTVEGSIGWEDINDCDLSKIPGHYYVVPETTFKSKPTLEELGIKDPWSNGFVNYISVDINGEVYGYTKKPIRGAAAYSENSFGSIFIFKIPDFESLGYNWKELIYERPKNNA